MSNLIDRQAAVDALVAETIYTKEELKEYYEANSHRDEWVNGIYDAVEVIEQLPPTQPEIVRCKDCKYWNSGSCEYHEHVVNCQDYWVGDIETEAEHFCGYAKRRDVTA